MGGLSGHMTHVYEDYNLKIKDVKNIISGILNSQIQLKEKVDGFNIHVSYRNGELRFYRNKTDIKNGGMSISDMLERWKDNPKALKVYLSAAKYLEPYIKSIEPVFVSGNDNITITLNVECVNGLTNVIPYKGTSVYIHNKWIWNGEDVVAICDVPDDFSGKFERVFKCPILRFNEYYPLSDNQANNMSGLFISRLFISGTFISEAFISEFENVTGKESDDCTLYDYYYKNFINYAANHFEMNWVCDSPVRNALFERIFSGVCSGESSINNLSKYHDKNMIKTWLTQYSKVIKDDCIRDLRMFFVRFGNFIMSQLDGYVNYEDRYFISDLLYKNYLSKPKSIYDQLLKQTGYQFNALEGVVFKYSLCDTPNPESRLYKLTGSFEFINKAMWGE